ncbi:MAG: glycosyltransferase family 2 protein [Patescibacteria group bacterium]
MSKVSIHLITWNGEKYIEECLNSILAQSFTDYMLIIIDNGSVDQTVKIVEEQFLPLFGEKLRWVKNKENLGFSRAHNQALLWTDSDYVLTLNQDVILEPEFISQAVEFLDKQPQVGSATGKILRWQFENDGTLKKSEKSDIIDTLGLKIFKSQRVIDIGAGEKDQGQYDQPVEIFGVSAPCAIYRRKALADVRYKDEFFDNDFFSYKEDVDLAYRLRWRGWLSFYLPQAVAYHKRSAKSENKENLLNKVNLRKNKNQFINYHSYKNHLFVLVKNMSLKNYFRYIFKIKFYEFKKFLYILFFEWSTLASLKEFFARLKNIRAKRKFIMSGRLVKDEEIRKWLA